MKLAVASAAALIALVGCGSKKPPLAPEPPPLAAAAYGHYLRGRLALIEGDVETAAVELGRAAQVAPDEPEIVVAFAEALIAAQRADDAISVAGRASERWPERADVAAVLGRALGKTKRTGEAIAALERALSLDPASAQVAFDLAGALVDGGQMARAEDLYREMIERDAEAIEPRLELAQLLLATGRATDARRLLDEVLASRADHVAARILQCRVFLALGDEAAAATTLVDGFVAAGERTSVARRFFAALMESGSHATAARFASEADDDALPTKTRAFLGRLLLRVGRPAEALELAKRMRAADSSDGEALVLAGVALARLGRFAEAASQLQKSELSLNSRILAAEWLTLAGKAAEARTLAIELPEDEPKRTYIGARIRELEGDVTSARAELTAGLEKWPNDLDLIFETASFELRNGNAPRAVALTEPLLREHPDDIGLVNLVGYALAEEGANLARAEALLSRALSAEPDDPNILDSFGWLQFVKKDLSGAGETLRRAHRLAPAEPEIIFHLGRLESALGRDAAAKEHYRSALGLAIEPSLKRLIESQLADQ